MNKFDAVIRQQLLCMKIPAPKGLSLCLAISKRLETQKRATLRLKPMCIS
jgi:hypothetical protein